MDISPPSPRSIQESSSSSSSEQQPFINLDDRRSLQVQDEISALEQQQQQLYDCEKEQIRLQNEIGVLLELVDNSGMRLKELEDGKSLNATQLRACFQENEFTLSLVEILSEHLECNEVVERHQREEMVRLSYQLESLQRENRSISTKLQSADLEAEALSKDIKNLGMQLFEKSDSFLPIEKRNISPASESKHSRSASADEVRNILDIMSVKILSAMNLY